MTNKQKIPKKVTAMLVYGRLPLVSLGMLCAIAVMWMRSPVIYSMGVSFLFISMSFDLVDGWFAARFSPNPTLANLAERIMDKIVYSIIFPLVAVGIMWRLIFISPGHTRPELLHAIFILILCVIVLIRDNFAHFIRSFAIQRGQEPELREFTRLRTIVAAPVGALLYAHAFYVPDGSGILYSWVSWLGSLSLRTLFIIEIVFLVINLGSIAGYCRKYGTYCLDDICDSDDLLRRRILSFFPNSLTIMNAIMGFLAVFFTYQGRIKEAYLILIGATIFDKLDGALARKLGLTELLASETPKISIGSILDDFADAISFCIAPAWIFYIILSDAHNNLISQLPIGFAALFYLILGIGRLVYFTLDKNPIPGFFKGMPTPAAALLVTAPLIIFNQSISDSPQLVYFWGVFCFATIIAAGLVMNLYPVKYLHLGRLMSRHPRVGQISLLLLLSVFTPYFGYITFTYMLLYLLSPIITGRIDPAIAARETKNIA
ncbi:CDP-alcohol phosphatidyltransferase family protein [Desulfobacterium sp. N47]|uniref:CDP-alcohol phosphatidyltransferase family protein n=1 Tax=Desulfobacterium sp. N47 TaxID=3115210 RepID=UPI003C9E2D43